MKLSKVRVTAWLSLVTILIMSGCGGSSNPPAPDTTAPTFTTTKEIYDVMEGLKLEINASATDDRGGVVRYSEDKAEFTINNLGILSFEAMDVSDDLYITVTVTATDEANNSAIENITLRVKDKGIENRTVMPEKVGRVFRDRKDGTVVNTHTGFLWEQNATSGKSWDASKEYCDSLNLGAITTWRLPTRMDINKLINYTDFPIGFDKEFSSNLAEYWTYEEVNVTTVWAISFTGSGGDNKILKDRDDVFIRCVSGEHKKASFSGDHNDSKRVDDDTGFEWNITKIDGNFTTAQNSCVAPYKLPTFNELLSIVEFDPRSVLGVSADDDLGDLVSSASIIKGFGRNMWTSTKYEEELVNKIKVLYITKSEISDGALEKNATAGILCVKK